jgi:hypothetical protein
MMISRSFAIDENASEAGVFQNCLKTRPAKLDSAQY